MLYSPSELEEELGVPARTIREWLGKGLPCQRDAQGHLWINRQELAAWINTMRRANRTAPLGPG